MPSIKETIIIENPTGSYKDFGLKAPEDYPIHGVNFYADYGYIPGYTGEDGHELDVFVGADSASGRSGYFTVFRSKEVPEEHKFYFDMTSEQLNKTLDEYTAVLVKHRPLTTQETLEEIEKFKKCR